MAVTVEEKWDSRRQVIGENPSQEVGYLIFGTDDDTTARDAMVSESGPFWTVDSLLLPIAESKIVQRLAQYIFEGLIVYSWNTPLNEGEELLSFDTSGGTQKVYQSQGTTSYPATGFVAPDYQGAIGVTDDGVEGVDIVAPNLTFTRQRRFPSDYVTPAWLDAVGSIVGQYNASEFYGRDPGEVRFDGASGQQRLNKPWDISFKFSVSPNASNLVLGPITIAQKLGWQYLWIRYRKVPDATSNRLVQQPLAAYVEDVVTPGGVDFTVLGIGS